MGIAMAVRVRLLLGLLAAGAGCTSGSQGVIHGDGSSEAPGTGTDGGTEDASPADAGPDRAEIPRPAGVLVRASMKSYVGVLLDDFPTDVRTRIADGLLLEPAAFWTERAARQVSLTSWYRFVAYKVIALPPPEQWQIELLGSPFRTDVDGHDVVAVEYSFTGVLLGDEKSPLETMPPLELPGNKVRFPFGTTLSGLPVDPDFLYERIAADCLDRTGAVLPFLVCPAAVAKWVGRVPTTLTFERLTFDQALADEVRRGDVTNGDGADLEVVKEGLANNEIQYGYFAPGDCAVAEGCVRATGWRRLLRFDATVHNKGVKPMHLGEVKGSELEAHHVFRHSMCHNHYHFLHYGDFTLGSSAGDKRAFCLMSTSRLSNNEWTPIITPYAEDCLFQGIDAGWGDTYDLGLDCQWIDITDVPIPPPSVTLPLTFVSNPDQFLCEGTPVLDAMGKPVFEPTAFKDENGASIDRPKCDFFPGWDANNSASLDVTLPPKGAFVTLPCQGKVFGPLRACGLGEQDAKLTCQPGQPVKLSCHVASSAAPQVLRVCRTSEVLGISIPCASYQALASAVVGADTTVSFNCPARLDAAEPGGAYSLYVGEAIPGDSPQKVICSSL